MKMYNELYEVWKKEKEKIEIQGLPKDFYAKLAGYVKKVREESRVLDKNTTRAKLIQNEIKNIEKMIEDIVELRFEKVQKRIMTEKTVPKDILTKEEEKLFQEIYPLAESYKAFLKGMLKGRLSQIERKEKLKQMIVRFLKPMPAIIGSDMKTYGPFKPEDIATLPPENAKILIKQGAAIELEANECS